MLSTIRLESYFIRENRRTFEEGYDLYAQMFTDKLEEIVSWCNKPRELKDKQVEEFLTTLNCLELEVQNDLELLEDVQNTIDKVLGVSIKF